MLEFIPRTRSKQVAPKLYTIVLADGPVARKLWVGFAYTFEDAFDIARQDALESFPEEAGMVPYWKPTIWESLDGDQLADLAIDAGIIESPRVPRGFEPKKDTEVAPPKKTKLEIESTPKAPIKKTIKGTVGSKKSELMKSLIRTKNVRALNLSKKKLTKAEYKYIYEKIKNTKGL